MITDSDHGRLDRDIIYDRAVGPMQFIPSTWRVAGVDADGDGVKNPQDMADAATATAVYLCSGPGDLRRPADLRAAILRYNASDSYVQMVTSIADAYRHGVSTLPAFDLASTSPATSPSRPPNRQPIHARTRIPHPSPSPARLDPDQSKWSAPRPDAPSAHHHPSHIGAGADPARFNPSRDSRTNSGHLDSSHPYPNSHQHACTPSTPTHQHACTTTAPTHQSSTTAAAHRSEHPKFHCVPNLP